jgi:thioredoxin 1
MSTTAHSATASDRLIAVCLCAQWCSSCRDYRATFDRVAAAFPDVHFLWIDIEDEADLVGRVDVDNFPTLLIGTDKGPGFFGPLLPQAEVLVRLIRTFSATAPSPPLADASVGALLRRIRALQAR